MEMKSLATFAAGAMGTTTMLLAGDALLDPTLLDNAVLLCNTLVLLGPCVVSPPLAAHAARMSCELLPALDYVIVRERYKEGGRPPSSTRKPTSQNAAVVPEGHVAVDVGERTLAQARLAIASVDDCAASYCAAY